MTAQEIRRAYLKFFEDRGHAVVGRAPLVLHDDPTTLFTTAGMQPLMPYLLGDEHPKGARIVDSQTCVRTQDIEEVGDNRHTTFFEMLGNWSLGDYFKEQQIPWFWEFLVDVVGLDPQKLYVTAFIGNEANNIPRDVVTADTWRVLFARKGIEAGVAEIGSEQQGYERGMKSGERIFLYDGTKNWWWRGTGIENMTPGEPGGPDTEVFYEFDFIEHDKKWGEHCHPNCDCGRFMEIGNSVFMEYLRTEDGFEKLPKQNVDFGGGLERIAAAAIDSSDMFKTSLMWPIIDKLQQISGKNYESHTESMRVIADHLRAATFLAVDGCVPSNKEQGYVMRRLIRRAIRYSFDLGVEQNFMQEIVPVIADMYADDFPEVAESRESIIAVLVKEEKAFRQTLRKGLNELTNIYNRNNGKFSGEDIFALHDTYGFPAELSIETLLVTLDNAKLDENWRWQFDAMMSEQRQRSQTARKGEFHGGLEGTDPIHLKYHTATHLLGQALRQVVSQDIQQHGSNITTERLRFDFNSEKLSAEQKQAVEDLVNQWIDENYPVTYKIYPTKEALEIGAIGAFGERYDDEAKVYRIGTSDKQISLEVCGGPHVENTGKLAENGKRFKIIKEEASSAGIRRIKAVLH
ncbi:alanine--tRNA ligase [Candidatus Saccharibacteria bacterium]|nr:alanine--tRNA ligase [Candidatus Saccharibacteria bacterium]NCU40453.1 alanine--tRNA ligase [Candidatus Saccharibacteria bacterium]